MTAVGNPLQGIRALIAEAGWERDGLELSIAWHDPVANVSLEDGASIGIANQQLGILRNVFVGRASYMLGGGMLSPNTVIGRYCSISYNSSVGAGRHAMERLSTGKLPEPQAPTMELPPPPFTIVGSDVWIGIGATVVGGVRIGHGACIGAGSVVTRDVPPYAVVAGVPARVIRMRFPDELVADLLDAKWWTLPEAVIAQMPYDDVRACVEFTRDVKAG